MPGIGPRRVELRRRAAHDGERECVASALLGEADGDANHELARSRGQLVALA